MIYEYLSRNRAGWMIVCRTNEWRLLNSKTIHTMLIKNKHKKHNTYRWTNRRNDIILNKRICYRRNTIWHVRSVYDIMASWWKILLKILSNLFIDGVNYILYYSTHHRRWSSSKRISLNHLRFFQVLRQYVFIS